MIENMEAFGTENGPAESFEDVQNLDELYSRLDEMGGVEASDGSFQSAESIKGLIPLIMEGKFDPKFITNSKGLRNAITRLKDSEGTSQ